MKVFLEVSGIGVLLVIVGFVALLFLIPALAVKSRLNTEFLSARAAYCCVVVGLILLLLAAVEVSVKDTVRGWQSQSRVQEDLHVSR